MRIKLNLFCRSFLLLSKICLASANLHATAATTERLTLGQAFSAANSDSPALAKTHAASEEAEWKRVEALTTYLPEISATAEHLLDKKYVFTDIPLNGVVISIPGITPTTTYGLGLDWSLFDGFRGSHLYRAARLKASAARGEHAWSQFKTARLVALDYYRALASKILTRVAENNLSTLKDHLRDVQLLKRSGISTNYDLLRVEVQVHEAESEVLNAEDNLQLAQTRLGQTLGRDESVEPAGELPELRPDLMDQLSIAEPSARADLVAMTERTEGLRDQETAAARHWVPKLSVFGQYLYYNNLDDQLTEWSKFRNAYSVGLRLKWELFDGLRSVARTHEAVAERAQGEANLRAERLKARQDTNVWTRKYKYFVLVNRSRQSDVGKATEAVRLAREGRRAGARTNTDLLDAESDLYRAQAGAISAKLGAIEALINVELATGQALYRFE